jgi:cytoplasmic iron level regulating protein YaaA (DUF328/UPF0246 family)
VALDAATFTAADITFAQAHLCVLSGLYGAVRPLDLIQPYRLCMNDPLSLGDAKKLTGHWARAGLTEHVTELAQAAAAGAAPVVVNMASDEYWEALDEGKLKSSGVRILKCSFTTAGRAGGSTYSKTARGLLAAYVIRRQVKDVHGLKGFDLQGYSFVESKSSEWSFVFNRASAPAAKKKPTQTKRNAKADDEPRATQSKPKRKLATECPQPEELGQPDQSGQTNRTKRRKR